MSNKYAVPISYIYIYIYISIENPLNSKKTTSRIRKNYKI